MGWWIIFMYYIFIKNHQNTYFSNYFQKKDIILYKNFIYNVAKERSTKIQAQKRTKRST
jgi:hypothetical protein